MNTSVLKKRLKAIINDKDLKYKEVEIGAGIPRGILTNFISGRTRTLKIDTVIAISKFLDIKLEHLTSEAYTEAPLPMLQANSSSSLSHTQLNLQLFTACFQHFTYFVKKNDLNINIENSVLILKRTYEYSMRYCDGELDKSFLEFNLLELARN